MQYDSFPQADAAHVRYGFGSIAKGETISLLLELQDEGVAKIRSHLGSHAQYHKKKFKTAVREGRLYIKRIA